MSSIVKREVFFGSGFTSLRGMFDEHDAGAERGLRLATANKSWSASFVLQTLGQNATDSALLRRVSAARRPYQSVDNLLRSKR